MTDLTDEPQELTEEDLQEMVEEAIDVIAMTLPENAGDDYWRAFRELVEARAQEFLQDDED